MWISLSGWLIVCVFHWYCVIWGGSKYQGELEVGLLISFETATERVYWWSWAALYIQLKNRPHQSLTDSVWNVFAPDKQLILSELVTFHMCRLPSFPCLHFLQDQSNSVIIRLARNTWKKMFYYLLLFMKVNEFEISICWLRCEIALIS